MQEPHIDPSGALIIASESVCFQDKSKILPIPFFSLLSLLCCSKVMIVSRSGYPRHGTQMPNIQQISLLLACLLDDGILGVGGNVHELFPRDTIFFRNAISWSLYASSCSKSRILASGVSAQSRYFP